MYFLLLLLRIRSVVHSAC